MVPEWIWIATEVHVSGETETMVGPFMSRKAAEEWVDARLDREAWGVDRLISPEYYPTFQRLVGDA